MNVRLKRLEATLREEAEGQRLKYLLTEDSAEARTHLELFEIFTRLADSLN